jgi:choline/glycine/proline betaine transport protein
VGQRIFWALLEGAVAAALLFAGGLKALQSVVISAGLPFTVLLLFVIYSLYQAFQKEANEMRMLAIKREREEYIESIKQLLKSEEEMIF